MATYYLGLDFGTSGARAIAIDGTGDVVAQERCSFPATSTSWPRTWQQTLWTLLTQLPPKIRPYVRAIALDGTSGTVLLCHGGGEVLTEPLAYDDGRGAAVLATMAPWVPAKNIVLSATSSLAKLVWWHQQGMIPRDYRHVYLLHQADWLGWLLHGSIGISDYHNALKLGYDVAACCYPDWLLAQPWSGILPQVLPPGTRVGTVLPAIAQRFGLPSTCQVFAGTTDSIAAFLASGIQTPGEAVTSLGSTLVVKLLSTHRVEAGEYGIYSHRLGNRWLVGGASNTGGAVLQNFFTPEELANLSHRIDPTQASPLQYYPLLKPGERFPLADPHFPPRLEPRPEDPVAFLHGLLEGMARIEAEGYRLLQTLGATPLQRVYTAGGGSQNSTWTHIRARRLQVPMVTMPHREAAYGVALLARAGYQRSRQGEQRPEGVTPK